MNTPYHSSSQDSLPDGYSLIPQDIQELGFETVSGGLKVGEGTLVNEAGCWHARISTMRSGRNGFERRWQWIDETDPRAVARYRRRAWLLLTGSPPPSRHKVLVSCGDSRCINPDHLYLVQLPKPEYRPPTGGRYGWIKEKDGNGEPTERWGWIPDPKPDKADRERQRELKRQEREQERLERQKARELERQERERAKEQKRLEREERQRARELKRLERERAKPQPKGKARGERHGRAKLTAEDVREIRRLATEGHRQGVIAARYGITRPAVYKILSGRSWGHV